MIFHRKFLIDAAERAVKTFAQTWAALLTASGLDILDGIALWGQVQVALLAALASFLMAVAGSQIGSPTAAWLPTRVDTEKGQATIWWVILGAVAAVILLALFDRIDL